MNYIQLDLTSFSHCDMPMNHQSACSTTRLILSEPPFSIFSLLLSCVTSHALVTKSIFLSTPSLLLSLVLSLFQIIQSILLVIISSRPLVLPLPLPLSFYHSLLPLVHSSSSSYQWPFPPSHFCPLSFSSNETPPDHIFQINHRIIPSVSIRYSILLNFSISKP